MFGFLALIFFVLAGFAGIILFMLLEKKKETPPQPEVAKSEEPQVSPKEVLGRLGLETPQPEILPVAKPSAPQTATQPTALESELSLKYDELFSQHRELQDKYTKLEVLLSEKNVALEKAEKSLNIELKNQKEFNKIKDILEKEIKDTKDKGKGLQADAAHAQTEAKTYQSRITQLEEKIKKLEISLLSSEGAINDAQSDTQLARKKVAELEGNIRELDNQILEKNQKIGVLVEKLKDLPHAESGVKNPETPVPPAALEPAPEAKPPEPPAKISLSSADALGAADVVLPPPPPQPNVDEKGGATEDLKTPSPQPQSAREEAPPKPPEAQPEPVVTLEAPKVEIKPEIKPEPPKLDLQPAETPKLTISEAPKSTVNEPAEPEVLEPPKPDARTAKPETPVLKPASSAAKTTEKKSFAFPKSILGMNPEEKKEPEKNEKNNKDESISLRPDILAEKPKIEPEKPAS